MLLLRRLQSVQVAQLAALLLLLLLLRLPLVSKETKAEVGGEEPRGLLLS